MSRTFRRTAAAFALYVSLLGPWTDRMSDLFDRLFWLLTPAPSSSYDNGCGLDPDGRCTPTPTEQPDNDNGCGIDPDGCSKKS